MSSKQATPQAANGQQEPASVGSSPPPSTSIYQGLRAIEPKREPKREPLFTTRPMTDDEFAEMVEAANSPSAKLIEELERENARLRELVGRARAMIDVSPEDSPDKWPSTDEINQLVKDCDDILPNDSPAGADSLDRIVRNFSPHELECCQHAAYACDHGESCWLPMEDMEMLQRAGLIELVAPSEDDTPEEDYYYVMTGIGEEIARRINAGDIIPNTVITDGSERSGETFGG
jgi:hypothetical protein